jgi:CRP-like cAMP-binding protein
MKLHDLAEIAQNLSYKFMNANEIVFDYGDDGDKFFIVLDGVCDILVPVIMKDDHVLTDKEKEVKRATL